MSAPDLHAFLEQRLAQMPPARAMGLRIGHLEPHSLALQAPLSLNLNDKGSAFGGSLCSVMTLAAWGLVSVRLAEAGYQADVYVQDASTRYLAPLREDLYARAWLAEGESWAEVRQTFMARGRARARLHAHIRDRDGKVCCTLEGRFVALDPRLQMPD